MKDLSLKLVKVSAVFSLVFLSACSNQYMSSEPQVDNATVMSAYSAMSAQMPGNVSSAISALDQNNTTEIFYVQSDKDRPPESVLSMFNMGIFNSGWSRQWTQDVGLSNVQIVFLDGYNASGTQADPRTFVLEVSMTDSSGAATYYGAVSAGDYEFTDSDFTAYLTDSNGSTITLHTTFLDKNSSSELNDTVTFDVYDGNDVYVGQITALHLYQ